MNKFLIIGGNARLARCFQKIYKKQSIKLAKSECDITLEASIRKVFSKYKFNYILNCAAITDIENCEEKPESCFRVNTLGVYLLNKICKEHCKKMIHISSDYAKDPINAYAWSKFLSEKIVDPKFLVVRTNFYDEKTFIVKNLLEGRKINVYKNVFFNPVSVNELAKNIYNNRNKSGLLNIFTNKKISYLQFAHRFCEIFYIKKELTKSVACGREKKVARPENSYIKSDIGLSLKKDLINFKKYLYENSLINKFIGNLSTCC
jgi:dTDP-4-dehydrorhamnose reductase